MLQKKFISDSLKLFQWDKQTKLLVAVSGGVDSIVLLELLLAIPEDERPEIGVAHVNHQLRKESEEEAEMVRQLCQTKGLPFYSYVWQSQSEQGNMESKAREVRYTFFAEVYKRGGYTGLVTAHHADDLAETLIMKLIKGTQLGNLASIRAESSRLGMRIYRPLLTFSKLELRDYAKANQLFYCEDQTNHSLDYQRNRIRHQVIPLLKEENPNFLNQVQNLTKQLSYTDKVLSTTLEPILDSMTHCESEKCWVLDLDMFQNQSKESRYLLLTTLIQKVMIQKGYSLSDRQVEAILSLIEKGKSQGRIDLQANWYFRKEYNVGYIEQVVGKSSIISSMITEVLGTGEYELSKTEKVRLYPEDEAAAVDHSFLGTKEEISLYLDQSDFPLSIRRRAPGDAIIYNKEGNHKKLRRLFIDEKIPQSIREKMWVVANSEREVLGVFTIGKSYLSIKKETDKIHYRLVYFKEEH
ncbi:tRNA lysidine(34) synthetase TilS [Vagococcus fessus]|uniref:tRNA(Ile)-lysidine synthase n=1 Tax=Vagococcus fessus TaxID=120370 RepID=A0A430A443_9ENTE|nr:tRNA lysidine(34) synthetase TilS [Vagococcus fessus]RSU01358.1 tRNA lysidine(34) synthetase TilS [Vagococcus fessus]